MTDYVPYILSYVAERSPMAAKKIKKNLALVDERHSSLAGGFFSKYETCLRLRGLSFDYALDCYLKLLDDMLEMRIAFIETGKYANNSFADVNERIYANPSVMDYHMHGLAIAQFLWHDQYKRYTFFRDHLNEFNSAKTYLEIGGGHGLYADAGLELLTNLTSASLIDISESSLRMSKCILQNHKVHFIHDDVFNLSSDNKFDFITIGEVIEHLENPLAMLMHLKKLLNPNGVIYITTPVNAPMIDHIYLFNNITEIRDLFHQAGYSIVNEKSVVSEEIPDDVAADLKIPVMYAAFLRHAEMN